MLIFAEAQGFINFIKENLKTKMELSMEFFLPYIPVIVAGNMSKLSFLEMQVEDFALFSEPKLLHPQFKFSRFVYLSENSMIYSRDVSSPKKKNEEC